MTRNILSTMPVLLVGSLALATLNLGGTAEAAPKHPQDPKSDTSDLTTAVRDAVASAAASAKPVVAAQPPVAALTTASTPTNYTVKSGDTVSGIAGRYHLSTASVLALNGLSWKSLIFPGQVLKLTKTVVASAPKPTTPVVAPSTSSPTTTTPTTTTSSTTTSTPTSYTVKSGDTVSGIAGRYHLSTASVLALNGLTSKSVIFPGQVLKLTSNAVAPAPAPAPAPTTPAATPPTTSAPTTTTSTSSTKYTVKSGDTVTSIAKKYSVTVTAILQANGLSASSIIYAGRTLTIPTTTTAPSTTGTQTAQVGATITPLSPTMKTNALTIIAVGKKLNVPSYGIVIALAAAAQESGLVDLNGGDRDSVGLFQQRPSTGWGTVAQLENTTYASELFYGGPSNPNKGKTRGLLDIPNWQSMTVTQAAQAVEISAYPDAYAKWEASARAWLAQLS